MHLVFENVLILDMNQPISFETILLTDRIPLKTCYSSVWRAYYNIDNLVTVTISCRETIVKYSKLQQIYYSIVIISDFLECVHNKCVNIYTICSLFTG